MSIDAHLETLERKHSHLEEELHSALKQPSTEDRIINELKRRKLRLKDEIERLKSTHA